MYMFLCEDWRLPATTVQPILIQNFPTRRLAPVVRADLPVPCCQGKEGPSPRHPRDFCPSLHPGKKSKADDKFCVEK